MFDSTEMPNKYFSAVIHFHIHDYVFLKFKQLSQLKIYFYNYLIFSLQCPYDLLCLTL